MALADLTQFKLMTGMSLADDSQDALLTQYLNAAQAAVRSYCQRGKGRTLFSSWPESGSDTEYLTGSNTPYLVLSFRPVTALTSLYVDYSGYYGDGPNAFAASTLLTAGTDYVLRKDSGTVSGSGVVVRLGGPAAGGSGGTYGWFPGYGGITAAPTLSAGRGRPVWLPSEGSIKATYTSGYTAANMPADLVQAVLQLAAWIKKIAPFGGMIAQSESLGDYSYSMATHVLGQAPELGSTRQLLSRYRSPVIG